jgi:2-polyprenyl-3-methyl-5-hydroxy-6-metoxy-1,4-benzoquinol methylase
LTVARGADVVSCNLCGHQVGRGDRAWLKDGYDVVRCQACGLIFRFELPSAAALRTIYDGSYFMASPGDEGGRGYLDYLSDEPEHRRNAQRRLDLLRAHGAEGPLLDIGAAGGFFVDEADRDGWEAVGVDVSQQMSAWAREKLRADVRTGAFLELDFPEAPFATVTMWDYLEHVVDPTDELERAAALLRPAGILALSTGDVQSPLARASGSRWHLLTPEHHNYFFSRATLARYLNAAGMDVLSMKFLWSRYSLGYVAHKTQTLTSHPLVRGLGTKLLRTRLANVTLPLNLFDIVTVVARKR